MKNIFAELTSRLDTAMVRINNLEDVSVETSQTEMQREKMEKKQNTQELWNNYQAYSILELEVLEEERIKQKKCLEK